MYGVPLRAMKIFIKLSDQLSLNNEPVVSLKTKASEKIM